ncbi:nickel/cobalt transporter [Salinicola endophyticus]|uniref:Nickel/cobalt efflux system n=1 Tax=Salinicola endophyticus TaxID=1949083 RepID=A0ABY8FD40_9GAMM|nr:nickel/cobalt transporter [Salinicola endophyticus]WFF40711.1 nickel/cobalt transporter [Salinicola endophyticus]
MSRLTPWRSVALALGGVLLAAALIYWLGWWQQAAVQVVLWQRDLYHALTAAITAIDRAPGLATWSVLLGVSFGYGVFHAAGPGHGKVVLSTYLASQGGAWRRAIALSALASLLQGLMAIALVAVLVFGLGWLTREAMASVDQAELASFVMVALVGLWLCWRSLRRLWRWHAAPRAAAGHAHDHDHAHDRSHEHIHDHGAGCGCGHDHHVSPQRAQAWGTAALTVLSIGIRPCSGAVLLLGASALLDQFGKGVVAVLAMSLGTALTVSSLALASVLAREWTQRRLAPLSGRRPWGAWVGFAGGAVILALGLSLSLAQWQQGPAPGAPFLGAPGAASGSPLLPGAHSAS